jgi:TonB family protein
MTMKFRVWIALFALTSGAKAEAPLINVLYPPPGYVGPQEDPNRPHTLPDLPAHARVCHEGGTIKITLTVAADGSVPSAIASVSSGYADLDAAALIQVRKWKFIPATKDNAPVAVRMVTTIELPNDTRAPDFSADCSAKGRGSAAAELWRLSGLSP